MLPAKFFYQGRKTRGATKDDVVDELNVHERCGRNQLFGHLQVLKRRSGVTAGVIVTEEDVGTIAHNGGAEYLRYAQHRAIDGPFIQLDILDCPVRGREECQMQ